MTTEFEFSIHPDWTAISAANEQTEAHLRSLPLSADSVDTCTMVICELMENGIKYGVADHPIHVTVRMTEDLVRIQVENTVDSRSLAHLKELDRTLQWIRGVQDPYQAFLERIRQISREPMDGGKSNLGLIRIAHEGRANLDFILQENNRLSVSAMTRVDVEHTPVNHPEVSQ